MYKFGIVIIFNSLTMGSHVSLSDTPFKTFKKNEEFQKESHKEILQILFNLVGMMLKC